jgi:hypothetical protein
VVCPDSSWSRLNTRVGEGLSKRVRRQHVVSQFYLKGFANESSQVRRVTLPGDQTHLEDYAKPHLIEKKNNARAASNVSR